MKRLAVLAAFCVIGSAHADKWNASNNPFYFNGVATTPLTARFNSLPLKAALLDESLGWSENYWRADFGGIAYRWNSPSSPKFTYKLHTKQELLMMSEDQLNELSPSELYDIAQGDYDYPLTKKILKMNSPKDLWWEGICHGWSLAAIHYPEPDQVVVRNKDGIQVPFGSSDVKGLLSLHDAFNSKGLYVRVGDRCGVQGKVAGEELPEDGKVPQISAKNAATPSCEDVNAGAFHIVITNMIGINSQGFVADIDRYNDVWNQPVKGYDSQVVGVEPLNALDIKNGVTTKVRVKTAMTYGDELEFHNGDKHSQDLEAEHNESWVSKLPVTGTIHQLDSQRHYEYVLELDATGTIIGGTWISETRPDMLWSKKKDVKFNNGFRFSLSGLSQIYRPVRR